MSTNPSKRLLKKYDAHLRSIVCREVLSGNLNYAQAARQYGIVHYTTVRQWVLDYRSANLGTNFDYMASKKPQSPKFSEQQPDYKKQAIALQKALDLAKLENLTLHTMIDIAESELKIDIRKKSGTKQ